MDMLKTLALPSAHSLCHVTLLLLLLVSFAGARVVDLTHKLDDKAITWTGNPKFNLTALFRGYFGDIKLWIEHNQFNMAEHTGTHIDSPAHLGIPSQWHVDDIPMEKLIGPGVVINVKEKVKTNPDYAVTVTDLQDWEEKYGTIPEGSIVLMNSGWSDKYVAQDQVAIFGITGSDLTNTSDFHFPAFSVEAVRWLLSNRDFNAIGCDTPSTDIGQSTTFVVHQLLSINQKVGIESVGYLDNMPESGSRVFVGVLKIREGSGGPARMFAIVDNNEEVGKSSTMTTSRIIIMVLFALVIYF